MIGVIKGIQAMAQAVNVMLYISKRVHVQLTHDVCPDAVTQLYTRTAESTAPPKQIECGIYVYMRIPYVILGSSIFYHLGTAPPLSNSWTTTIIWLYIALNRTPSIDCCWVGAVPYSIIYLRGTINGGFPN